MLILSFDGAMMAGLDRVVVDPGLGLILGVMNVVIIVLLGLLVVLPVYLDMKVQDTRRHEEVVRPAQKELGPKES